MRRRLWSPRSLTVDVMVEPRSTQHRAGKHRTPDGAGSSPMLSTLGGRGDAEANARIEWLGGRAPLVASCRFSQMRYRRSVLLSESPSASFIVHSLSRVAISQWLWRPHVSTARQTRSRLQSQDIHAMPRNTMSIPTYRHPLHIHLHQSPHLPSQKPVVACS
jgi:hypothetical protein